MKKGLRVEWEKSLKKGGYFSDFFTDRKRLSSSETLRKAFSLAKNFVNGLNLDKKVVLTFTDSKKYTGDTGGCVPIRENVYRISLDTDLFKEAIPDGFKLDVFSGLATHEVAHVLFTDFGEFRYYITRSDPKYRSLYKSIWNVIEDARIESLLVDEYPGTLSFLEQTRKYFLERTSDRVLSTTDKLFSVFFKVTRVPHTLTEEELENYSEYIDELDSLIYPLPKTCGDVSVVSDKVFKTLEEYLNKEEDKKEEPKDSSDKDESPEDLDDSEETKSEEDSDTDKSVTSSGSESGESEETLELPDLTDEEGSAGSGEESEGTTSDSDSGSSKEVPKVPELSEDMKDFLEKLTSTHERSPHETSLSKDAEKYILSEISEEIERVPKKEVYFYRVGNNKSKYLSDAQEVSKFSSTMASQLKFTHVDRKLTLKGTRSGYLDTNKLAEAVQGVGTVYERYGREKSQKISLTLLLDMSGSMGSRKMTAARQTAILIKEALAKVNDVSLFIYGHSGDSTTDNSTDIYIFKEPGVEYRYSLGNATAKYQNRDGVAIRAVVDRVRTFTQNPMLLLFIADGAPEAYDYSGKKGIDDVRLAVKEVAKKNVQVISVSIESSYDPAQMFKHYFKFTNLAEVPKQIGLVMKKVVSELTKSSTIYY